MGISRAVQDWETAHPGEPFIAYVGDSIVQGYPNYQLSGPPSWTVDPSHDDEGANIVSVVEALHPAAIPGLNRGWAGAQVGPSYLVLNGVNSSFNPKYILWQIGINSIQGGANDWDDVSTYYDQALTSCTSAGSILIVAEVWPASLATGTVINAYNDSMNAWAVANGVEIIHTHDWMANPSNNDQLNPPWGVDGTHPSNDGVSRFAEIILDKLIELEGEDPDEVAVVRSARAPRNAITILV